MTDERKPGDEGPVEAWDDEGGAAQRDETAVDQAAGEAPDDAAGKAPDEVPDGVERAKRWTDEHTEHWHGARSSDATQARAEEE
jgi:hypothetical protein